MAVVDPIGFIVGGLNFMERNIWKDGIFGLVVGDALGVPVEFSAREELKRYPVTGMRAYGTHNQPAGTWSDDSSMTFATLESIKQKGVVDNKDIMDKFSRWRLYADYTPFHDVFDIGIATSKAIFRYGKGCAPTESGGKGERDNGNGSLMRILPVCLYLYHRQKSICTSEDESIYIIHNASALTHAHARSQIACGIYYFMVKAVIEKTGNLIERLQYGIDEACRYYRRDLRNKTELEHFSRIFDLKMFEKLPQKLIKSSGYVVDTLEAVIWCLLTTASFQDAVLQAVNLGDDTDTVGAITGGLAGLYYGYDAIPTAWVNALQRREWIEGLVSEMEE